MYTVYELKEIHGERLSLKLISGEKGLRRPIKVPEAHRPGLMLAGFIKSHAGKRIVVFGKLELEYLQDLKPEVRLERLEMLLSFPTPAVIVARGYKPPEELKQICSEKVIPLFTSPLRTMPLLNNLTILLAEAFSPQITCHGTLVEVFGVGVLIQGDSSVGKSETALGLIERGHRLIADDSVRVKKKEEKYVEGSCAPLTKHHMEIRGIGIINIAHLYGAVCVRDSKSIDIVVKLELWDDSHYYDRIGLEEKTIDILGMDLPFHLLPVKPGRDVVLLLETIALNHRLKNMGYHSALEFHNKLTETMHGRNRRKIKN
ncbi:MAG: HPr kinase/phosphorylase [Chlamydiia bacterium]|nr:HPr kinase/phosphorylase [Chlamydiia bacterium]